MPPEKQGVRQNWTLTDEYDKKTMEEQANPSFHPSYCLFQFPLSSFQPSYQTSYTAL